MKFLASSVILNHIRESIEDIAKLKDNYFKYKDFLLSNIFPKLELTSNEKKKSAMNICSAIAIIVLIGALYYWPESLIDVMQMSYVSDNNCIYSAMILGSIHHEIKSMNIAERDKLLIKEYLIDKNGIICNYIKMLFDKVKEGRSDLFKDFLNVIESFSQLNVDLFNIPSLVTFLLSTLPTTESSNMDIINEVLMNAFENSYSAKVYVKNENNDTMYINKLIAKCNDNDLQIVNEVIGLIINLVTTYQKKEHLNENEKLLLFYTANIFSSLCNSYIFLFFNKNTLSTLLFDFLLYFISFPILKLSSLFFDTITKMKDFIDRDYNLLNYSQNEKENFKVYLFKLNDAVMHNSKLKTLKVNYKSILRQQNIQNLNDITLLTTLEDDDTQMETNDISVIQYRKQSEDALNDIFLIVYFNYGEQGIGEYLKRLGEMLIKSNKSNEMNDEYLFLVEVVLFNIKCIKINYDLPNMNPQMLLNFSNFIAQSNLVQNEKIMVSFISFLDSIAHYVPNDQLLYINSISFLLTVCKSISALQNIGTLVISNIISFTKEKNFDVFNMIYSIYEETYDMLSCNSLSNLTEAMVNCGIKKESPIEEVFDVVNKILFPLQDSMKKISQSPIKADLLIIQKAFDIYYRIIKNVGRIHPQYLYEMFNKNNQKNNMYILFNFFQWLISVYSDNCDIMNIMVLFLIRLCYVLKGRVELLFNEINNIIFTLQSKNPNVYNVIDVMRALYSEIIANSSNSQLKQSISNNFLVICAQVITNIKSMTNNNIDGIASLALFFASMISALNTLNLEGKNFTILKEVFELFLTANSAIMQENLNLNVLKAIKNFYCNGTISEYAKCAFTKDIVQFVFPSLGNYFNKMTGELASLLCSVFNVNKEGFAEALVNIPDKDIIIEYFKAYSDNKIYQEKMERFIFDLMNVKKGKANREIVMKRYSIELTQRQLILNKKNITNL